MQQVAVDALAADQRLRRAILANRAALHDHDPIEVAQAREAMRDSDDGPAAHQAVERLPNGLFRIAVERRGRLVQEKNGRIFEERARNTDALALTGRQFHTAVAHDGRRAIRQSLDELLAIRRDDRLEHLGIGGVRPAIADVLHDRAVEQGDVLRNDCNRCPQALLRHPGDVLAADQDAPALHIIEALQQRKERRFSAARLPNQADALTRLDAQAELGEHLAPIGIAECDVLE